ncbi:hypothetical protein QAD02_011428 [Eretmocerus hayati]|uniref:Uncharacterized protein n=1 Tax=Eretmocerus hayati TaxID=131215 RepID=A0ACC2NZM2_9HYME|nr:hypothetical protein QAD02_011428 [Eretmocerus hayati]
MSEKCTVLEKEIDLRDAQLERYENELKIFAEKVDEIAEFKLKHEDLLEERLILKQELVDLLNANKTLEEKLSNQSLVPKSKKQEIVSLFREEYKILQERIDSEWKEKLEKQLEESKKALDTQVHFKMELMKIYLNAQYIGNKYLIAGHVAQCYTALEILTGVNNWMQQTMGFPVVTDASTWITRLSILQKIEADQETEYSKLVACLNCDATQKLQLFDVTLKKPEFPAAPNQTLGSIMRNVLTALYNDQRAIIQHLMRESMSQRMAQNRALPYDFGSHSSSGWGMNTPIPRTQGIDSPSRVLVQAFQNTGISHPYVQQQHSANYSNAPSSISLVSASSSQSSRKSSLSEQLCFSAKSSTNSSIASDPLSHESKIVGETAMNRKDDFSVEETNSIGKVILGRGDAHWTDDTPTKTDSNSTEECDDTSEAWARLASQIDKLA